MTELNSICIELGDLQEGLTLIIDERQANTMFETADAVENNEAVYQLVEGSFYHYTFSDDNFRLEKDQQQIVQPHSRLKHTGTLSPNIYVGTLSLPVYKLEQLIGEVKLEVRSLKSGYRDDYRDMLELITEKCTELLLQANAPAAHHFEVDYTRDYQTNYQRFSFIRSIVGSDEFSEAVHRIVTHPVTRWAEIEEYKDVRQVRRFTNANVRELLKGSNRTPLPSGHQLKQKGLTSLPEKITGIRKTDSVDTPENRFIKHALEVFLKFCSDINSVSDANTPLARESENLTKELEGMLHHTIFRDISRPTTLKLNSPVLQRKEGYREVLRVWLMFDLAAKLIWEGGEDVYSGGKKDIATLYEYWLFFKLLELFEELFEIVPKELAQLIQKTDDGMNLNLKQGEFTALRGTYDSPSRKLEVQFNYNRPFSGKKAYPASGSWTTTMRPDYTLSIWPGGIPERMAEEEELIVHIHFDAKYKIANLKELLESRMQEDLSDEKTENRKGIYKNADLLKMHAYKDAIRRTGGAYVLYPGETSIKRQGFHEIIPGLGAFPIRPSKTDTGIGDLKAFLEELLEHFINRTSQREKLSFRTYDIHKAPPKEDDKLTELLPEAYGENRGLLPDRTFVLVGYYKDQKHLDWIKKKKLYNFRMGTGSGSLVLDAETVGAKFLLLHGPGDETANILYRIVSRGPRIVTKEDLDDKGYSNATQQNYLLVELEEVLNPEFQNLNISFKKLEKYKSGRTSAVPFSATLAEILDKKTLLEVNIKRVFNRSNKKKESNV